MVRAVVLLRGINVGGHRKVPMADLRSVLADAHPAHLHVGFLTGRPAHGWDRGIDTGALTSEAYAVVGHHLYLHLPNGMGRSRLAEAVTRAIGVPVTVRNWRTVTTLVGMLQV